MEDIKEKEVKELSFTNVDLTKLDVAKLDTEHVYIFKLSKDVAEGAPVKDIETMLKHLSEMLNKLNIKYIVLADDIFTITELVPSEKEK